MSMNVILGVAFVGMLLLMVEIFRFNRKNW